MTPEKTLLYIDDKEALRTSFQWALGDMGVGEIITTETGEQGLQIITPDTHIVVSDYDLGAGMDGIEVLKTVMNQRPDIFRVLHSSYVSQERGFDKNAKAECAPHILLPKPFELQKFVDDIHSLLKNNVRAEPDE